MFLIEKTEFPFFELPIFQYCPLDGGRKRKCKMYCLEMSSLDGEEKLWIGLLKIWSGPVKYSAMPSDVERYDSQGFVPKSRYRSFGLQEWDLWVWAPNPKSCIRACTWKDHKTIFSALDPLKTLKISFTFFSTTDKERKQETVVKQRSNVAQKQERNFWFIKSRKLQILPLFWKILNSCLSSVKCFRHSEGGFWCQVS